MSRILRWVLSSGLVLGTVVSTNGPAIAAADEAPEKIHTVRYSYEAWSRAGKKRFVLVPAPADVRQGAFKDRTKALFDILKAAKGNTYGATKIAFNDDADTTGEVYVWLDPAKTEYHPIIMAETVYTFTENGARRVRFPKVQDAGWTRAEVPNAAFVLTVPLIEALPPVELPGALVSLPDGSLLPFSTIADRLKGHDKALVDAMWTYVKNGPVPATLLALDAGRRLALPDIEARVIPVLDSANPQVRAAALGALAGRDNPTVNKALRKVLDDDPDAAIQDQAAAILSQSKDPAFSTAAQYHALKSKDAAIVAAAAKGLSDSKQAEAGVQLLKILSHPDAKVRTAAIESLQRRGDHGPLSARLADEKLDAGIRVEIAAALAKGNHAESKHAGLSHLAVHGRDAASVDAATALGGLDQAGTYDALGRALSHAQGATRAAAATALGRLGQPRSLPVLSKAKVDDPESGTAVLDAIRTIYAGQKAEIVLKACKESDPVLRRMAVASLGEIVRKGSKFERKVILETLRTLAADDAAGIRAAATRSFADMGGDDVRPDILKLAADGAIEVQRAAAFALGLFPGKESVKFLLGYAQQKDAELLAHAIGSLGKLQEREALDPVISRLKHEDLRVKRAATGALVRIGEALEPGKRNPMLQYFSEQLFDADAEVRLKALEGLVLVKDARVVGTMAPLVQDPVIEVRKATLLAMATTGDASAVEGIATGLDDDHADVRKTALEAFRRLKRKEAVSVLTGYVKKEQDKALADEANKLLLTLKGT